jgi:glycerol-3-phosphate dehydrogenase
VQGNERLAAMGGGCDLAVIGGGVVGAGIALDAAARGLAVCLVEQADFASGTSSRSTKLLHGGVRYLPQMRFGLVRQSLREQLILRRTADYLVEPLDFVIPVYRHRGFADAPVWARRPWILPTALRLGLWAYDRLGGRRGQDLQRRVSAAEVLERFPRLRADGLRHAIVYRDYQTDDARFTLALVRTARAHGATAWNWVSVDRVESAEHGYRLQVTDRLLGGEATIPARTVVAATGAFPPPPGAGRPPLRLRLSKGTHLTVAAADLGLTGNALLLPETDDGRVLFLVPWAGYGLVGTTDTEYRGDPASPTPSSEDIDYLLRHVAEYLDLDRPAILSAWSGLRALVDQSGGGTAAASREHRVQELAPGYFQVAGGKLTGYRHIAAEVVDGVCRRLGQRAPCGTDEVLLVGAGGGEGGAPDLRRRAVARGLSESWADRLAARYGTEAGRVLDLIEEEPRWAVPLQGTEHLQAEVVFAARHESAATVADVLLRRTHIAWTAPDHGRAVLGIVASLLAAELGWDAARLALERRRAEETLAAEGL